jgi:hypothetical protein
MGAVCLHSLLSDLPLRPVATHALDVRLFRCRCDLILVAEVAAPRQLSVHGRVRGIGWGMAMASSVVTTSPGVRALGDF